MAGEITPFDLGGSILKGAQIEALGDTRTLRDLAIQKERTALTNQNALRQYAPAAVGGDRSAVAQIAAFDPATAITLQNHFAQQDQQTRERALKEAPFVAQALSGVTDQQGYEAARSFLTKAGVDTARMPQAYDPGFVGVAVQAAQKLAEPKVVGHQLVQPKPGGGVDVLHTAPETERVQTREFSDGVYTINRDGSRGTKVGEAPTRGHVTTAEGIFAQNADGSLGKRLGDAPTRAQPTKPVPANINTAITENLNSVRKVDQALAAADKYPEATGFWIGIGNKYLPGDVLNKLDPEGREARMLIADLGSLRVHDRSGAAVTAAEFPRLKPFIPEAGDNPDTVKAKLKNFRNEYANILRDMHDIYSEDQGYKGNPVLKRFVEEGNAGGFQQPKVGETKDGGGIPTFKTPSDPGLAKLPSGSVFYDDKGTLRTKP